MSSTGTGKCKKNERFFSSQGKAMTNKNFTRKSAKSGEFWMNQGKLDFKKKITNTTQ